MDTTITEIPHILNLQDDILLHIFNLNTLRAETENYDAASMLRHDNPPLDITRGTSQVCRYWRRVILGSPSIWGSLINLGIIESDAWAEEVMARAGSAYLSVYGSIGHAQQSCSLFKSLVVNHWDRIRRIYVPVCHAGYSIDHSVWKNIQNQPAPNLESFVLRFDYSRLVELSAPWDGSLFANSAPSLRRFHDGGSRLFNLNPNFAWIHQLSSLTLSNPLFTSDVLNILYNTVRLESLTVYSTIFNHSSRVWTKQIHLPRLNRLDIEVETAGELLVYLENIVPQHGCSLLLSAQLDEQDPLEDVQLPSLTKLITSYSNSYFNIHKPTKFHIQDTNGGAFTVHSEKDTEMVYFGHPELRFSIFQSDDWSWQPPSLSFDQIFIALSSTSLHYITQLALHIIQDDSWIHTGNPGFVDFICSFPSVEDLSIPDETLLILNRILPDYPQAFPSLRRVELSTGGVSVVALTKAVSQFLSDRKAAKTPILTLAIDDFSWMRVKGNWRFLDGYEDMHLLWVDQGLQIDYKCGSGEM